MADAQGKRIEDSKAPMAYLHGNTLPKIEAELDSQIASYQTTL